MSDLPRKRRWFQLHLSTCLALMFVAGGLVGANVLPRHERPPLALNDSTGEPIATYGWPYRAFLWGEFKPGRVVALSEARFEAMDRVPAFWNEDEGMVWYWLLPNFGVGFAILVGTVVGLEWLIVLKNKYART